MSTEQVSPIAAHVIAKCGGPKVVADLCEVGLPYVYRWSYPKSRGGLSGRVPEAARTKLLKAALDGRVSLTPADFEEGWAAIAKANGEQVSQQA